MKLKTFARREAGLEWHESVSFPFKPNGSAQEELLSVSNVANVIITSTDGTQIKYEVET